MSPSVCRYRAAFGIAIALLVVVTSPARAVSVDVVFSGVVDEVTGPVPGGPFSPGAAFSGRVQYETQAPIEEQGASSYYEIVDGTASLELRIDSVLFATDAANPQINIGVHDNVFVNRQTGQPVPPGDPDGVFLDLFAAVSGNNVPVEGDGSYAIKLTFSETSSDTPPTLLTSTELPAPSELLAVQLIGAQVEIRSGNSVAGTITAAAPIPEPCSASLLLAGLAGLAARGRFSRGSYSRHPGGTQGGGS